MIKYIEIENFRSIHKTSLALEPLSVIVGANATGKSNLIRALEFSADLVENGLSEAIHTRGGYQEIIPKQYNKTFGVEVKIRIVIELDPPQQWEEHGLPPLNVDYSLAFTQSKQKRLKITSEQLTIEHCLLNSYFLQLDEANSENVKSNHSDQLTYLANTNITLTRNSSKIGLNTNWEDSEENRKLFITWLGFDRFRTTEKISSEFTGKQYQKLVNEMFNLLRPGAPNEKLELIMSHNRMVSGLSQHFTRAIEDFVTVGKYDLLINELRQEQNVSGSTNLDISGKNVPTVAGKLKDTEPDLWHRILNTMSNISPYFKSVQNKTFRAGKEYLEFAEIFGGKGIASWESSDGTLRAFATLVAIENTPEGSTILLEEPEHGLHPWAIKDLLGHIRESVRNRFLQVIITTHSQQVLECLDKSELLITERNKNGTKFYTLIETLGTNEIEMGEIGELWVRGLLKGVPVSID